MNFRLEQKVKAGEKPTVKAEDFDVTHEPDERGAIPSGMVDAAKKAATAAAEGIDGAKLVTIEGHRKAGKGAQPQHLVVTVSRELD
jgi:hypothetical protein